tara:strand:- start:1461 stop:1913 length:453 start_codon:yes stop_codon:yes gene_type:complete
MATLLSGISGAQWLLTALLAAFIFTGVRVPDEVRSAANSSAGAVVVIVIALATFLNTNIIVGVLTLVAAYELLRRSRDPLDIGDAAQNVPSEAAKVADFEKYNSMPSTLEQEMVQRMAPLVKHGPAPGAHYQPTLTPQNSAAPLGYSGIV